MDADAHAAALRTCRSQMLLLALLLAPQLGRATLRSREGGIIVEAGGGTGSLSRHFTVLLGVTIFRHAVQGWTIAGPPTESPGAASE